MASPELIEILKAVGGPFIGAGLAFLANNWIAKRKTRDEQLSAGNMALIMLDGMALDFYIYRGQLWDSFAAVAGKELLVEDFPWRYVKAGQFAHSKEEVNLASLAFLLETKAGRVAIKDLSDAINFYLEFRNAAAAFADAGSRVRSEHAALGNIPLSEVNERLARLTRMDAMSSTRLLVDLCRDGELVFTRAGRGLRQVLRKRFGDRIVDVEAKPLDKFSLSRLPPLPPVLKNLFRPA